MNPFRERREILRSISHVARSSKPPEQQAWEHRSLTCRRCGETKTEPIAKLPVDVTKKFKDVDPSMWSAPAIQYVFDQGLMTGVSEDEFDPEGEMTRGMIITVIWKMEGKPAASGKAPFKDLTDAEKEIVYHGPAEKKHIFYHSKNWYFSI